MNISTFPSGPFATNAYLVTLESSKEAVIIDPAPDSAGLILKETQQKGYHANQIWLTHSHWDHFGDLAKLKQHFKAKVWVHSLDAPNLASPGADGLPMLMPIEGVEADHFFEEGQEIKLGRISFKVIHTPGHSPGGVCLYCEEKEILFSGDTLFKGSIGNLSFPTSNAEEMWKSLNRLAKLPPKTQVFPGHGESTILAQETWLPHAKKYFS